jgi:hypothetical protein
LRTRILKVAFSGLLLAVAFAASSDAGKICVAVDENDMTHAQTGAPVDYGYGPGRGKLWTSPPLYGLFDSRRTRAANYKRGVVPAGLVDSRRIGFFGAPVSWPINGLHQILLPDGRVMNYGTDDKGRQGAALLYDVWDPALGTGPESHMVLSNTTKTDIFCSAQSLLWSTGEVLITGGDLTVDGKRNFSNNKTTIFSPLTNTIRTAPQMAYPRWYPTMVAMPNGEMVVIGGRIAPFSQWAKTPEVYSPVTGSWRTLTGATDSTLNGDYPRAFLRPDGRIFYIGPAGDMATIDTAGNGSVTKLPEQAAQSDGTLATVMYRPGKLLSLRFNDDNGVHKPVVQLINIWGHKATVTNGAPIDQLRSLANATLLADGTVFVSGGSRIGNKLPAIYTSMIWDPRSGAWTQGATSLTPRLYHSIALLLPDATVLTAAGGSPGPVVNLNAEIYYPAYLYDDATGQPATRPVLVSAPAEAKVGQKVVVKVKAGNVIGRVTFVRTGSVTHVTNNDQRFLEADFKQDRNTIVASLPKNPNVALPGYYMMFVFENGIPSVSKIIHVTP